MCQPMMAKTLVNIAGFNIDMWALTHILLYVYFGYCFPDYFIEFLIIGSAWELLESFFCLYRIPLEKIIGCNDLNNPRCRTNVGYKNCDYWYGRIDDVVMNMIGFIIGAFLAKKY